MASNRAHTEGSAGFRALTSVKSFHSGVESDCIRFEKREKTRTSFLGAEREAGIRKVALSLVVGGTRGMLNCVGYDFRFYNRVPCGFAPQWKRE
jgi:hypothetical protein